MSRAVAVVLLVFVGGCGGCEGPAAISRDAAPSIDAEVVIDAMLDAASDVAIDSAPTGPFIRYLKASNTQFADQFGREIAISADGTTVAIAAPGEASAATGINGDQSSNALNGSGAVYVFVRGGASWVQQAYIKASNSGASYDFGCALALSSDGGTLVVGSRGEHSGATGVNGSQADDNLGDAGAAYVFTRSGTTWSQQAYLKASNTNASDMFGYRVALAADGNTLAVGAQGESSSAVGIGGDQTNNNANLSGAVYVFTRSGTTWSQQAYLKASNTGSGDYFGYDLAIAGDGATLAVGAHGEQSGIPGDPTNNATDAAGAVYVFRRSGSVWSQQAYLKAPYPSVEDRFGTAVSLSSDGSTLAVGSENEDSNARGIGQDAQNETAVNSGAVWVFSRSGTVWSTPVYIKASNADAGDFFGSGLALAPAGDKLLVGARGESSASLGYAGDPTSNGAATSGAVYQFTLAQGTWSETRYLKASNTDPYDGFGTRVAIASDSTIVVSAPQEMSSATGVDGNQQLDDTASAGAAYLFE